MKNKTDILLIIAVICIFLCFIYSIYLGIENCTTKYLVIDNATKQEWISIGRPVSVGNNTTFHTSKDEGVILRGSVIYRKLDE